MLIKKSVIRELSQTDMSFILFSKCFLEQELSSGVSFFDADVPFEIFSDSEECREYLFWAFCWIREVENWSWFWNCSESVLKIGLPKTIKHQIQLSCPMFLAKLVGQKPGDIMIPDSFL